MPKAKITSNIPLSIASLVIGFLIWLVVINIDNPTESRTFTLSGDSVELINTAYIDSFNKMCMQEDDPVPVKVTVTAERSVLRRLSASNIQLYADLQQAVSLETDPVMVPITAICTGITASNVKLTPQYLGVRLEDKVSAEFVVNVSYGETKPGRGYEVGSQSVSPEKVKITGPKSLIGKIDKVNALVSVTGKNKDVSEEISLSIRDKNQDLLSDGRMAYLTIDNNGKVTVTTKFWRVQPGVAFDVATEGKPAAGYHVESLSTVPDTVSVAGTENALELLRMDGNVIRLSAEEMNISGEKEDIEYKLSLPDYLPEETKLTSGTSEDVYVNVEILPDGSHSYYIPTGDVDILNIGDDLLASFESDTIRIRVAAEEGYDIEDFDPDEVSAEIDLEQKEAGTMEVPVNISLPEGYRLLEKVTADVIISWITNLDESVE